MLIDLETARLCGEAVIVGNLLESFFQCAESACRMGCNRDRYRDRGRDRFLTADHDHDSDHEIKNFYAAMAVALI